MSFVTCANGFDEITPKPGQSKVGHALKSPGLFKQVRCSGHDLQTIVVAK